MEDLIKALQIFLKYGNPKYPTWCSHDTLNIADIDPVDVSDEDKEELKQLGFIMSGYKGEECFISFTYGSC